MKILLIIVLGVFSQEAELSSTVQQIESEILDILEDLKEAKQDLEYQFEVLAKISFDQTVNSMIQTAKSYTIKARKTNNKITKITDVAILDVFNSEIDKKCSLADSQLNGIEKHIEKGSITKRLEKFIDFYVKRSQVPDTDLETVVHIVEKKAGELKFNLKKTYSLNWIYILLVIIAIGQILVLRGIMQAQKKHIF